MNPSPLISWRCRQGTAEDCQLCTGCDHDCHHVGADQLADGAGLRGLIHQISTTEGETES